MSGAHSNAGSGAPRRLPPGEYGCHPAVPAAGALVLIAGVIWVALSSGRDQVVAGGLALAGLVALLVGWGWRRRLSADRNGLTLRGLTGTRQIGWAQVDSLRPVVRTRYGISGTTLEIDLDDDGLVVLGRIELGLDPAEAADELNALRRPGRTP